MDVDKIKTELKERVAKGLNFGVEGVEEVLDPSAPNRNSLILLKSKYNDLMQLSMANTLPYEQIEIGLDKLRVQLLHLIDQLSADDLEKHEVTPDLKINTLPTRRTNFFKLVEIHFQNLDQILYQETMDNQITSQSQGREAIFQWYRIFMSRRLRDIPLSVVPARALSFFEDFDNGRFEVYFKNIKHLMAYTLASEIEQQFFLDTLRSLFTRFELAFQFYYACTELDPSFREIFQRSKLVDESLKDSLVSEEHWELLKIG